MQASRKYRRDFRQSMYYVKRYGLDSHVKRINNLNKLNYLYHLLGMANFINDINPNDKEVKEDYQYLKNLLLKISSNE